MKREKIVTEILINKLIKGEEDFKGAFVKIMELICMNRKDLFLVEAVKLMLPLEHQSYRISVSIDLI